MEASELTQALRRYTEAGEPPFSLTANALISQARRRHRWRVGLGVGASGVATTLAVFSAMALVPAGGPALGPGGCDVALPLGTWAGATGLFPPAAYPTKPPASPAPEPPGSPTPVGSRDPSLTPKADNPSGMTPLPGGASAPAAPQTPPEPQSGLGGQTAVIIAVDEARIDEMSCFLKHRMLKLRPGARYVPVNGQPMDVVWNGAGANKERPPYFEASAHVIDGPLLCQITVTVFAGDIGPAPGLRHHETDTIVTVKTSSSTIIVTVEGGAITDDQAMSLARAPELDVYR